MPSLTFTNLTTLWVALGLVAATQVVAFVRRPDLPRVTLALVNAGLLLIALAAGGLTWQKPAPVPVEVMVDLSPSTRTAAYRERAALQQRLAELLGDVPYRLSFFSGGPFGPVDAATPRLPDMPAERTVFAPPATPAVLLLSDVRFDLPAVAPPTYVVIDPNLDATDDAAITALNAHPADLAVTTANSGATSRPLRISGAGGSSDAAAPPGTIVITRPLPASPAGAITTRLAPGDAWPENDVLSAFAPPPPVAQRWWVGRSPPPDGSWRPFPPADLPTDPAAFLAPSVVVLDNVAATDLSDAQQQRLQQHVRDLGGGLLLLGGDRAFAAGDYGNSLLEPLSPLSSAPPEPRNRWMLLADSSGSMNEPAAGRQTRWRHAVEAIRRVLPTLPPNDRVDVGGFARDVAWWVRDTSVRVATTAPLPPPGAAARGPTELRAALQAVAGSLDASLPTQLLLLTDANADLGDVAELSRALTGNRVRLHLLLIGDAGDAADAARTLVTATGGSILAEADPQKWADAAQKLARAAKPDGVERSPLDVRFTGDAAALPPRTVTPWNRTWLKPGAVALADATPAGTEQPSVPVARRGDDERVVAAAFATNDAELAALVRLCERPPRDPRFNVTWETAPKLRVTVDAAEGDRYLNGLQFGLALVDELGKPHGDRASLVQIAPGRYRFETDPPNRPLIGVLTGPGGSTIDRAAVPGRYAPEFNAVGSDRRAMRELASRTGGAVIELGNKGPLDLPRPRRAVELTSWLATLGAALIATGMMVWRLR